MMRTIKAIIKNDIRNYVLSKEFLFFTVIFPAIIIFFSIGISSHANKPSIDVYIVNNDYAPIASSILSNNGFNMVSSNPDIILELTKTKNTYKVNVTGVVHFTEKNVNFNDAEKRIQSAFYDAGDAPQFEYYAFIDKNGKILKYNPVAVVETLNNVLVVTTLFVFFLVFMGLGTIISSVVEDKRSRFLDEFLASPAKKRDYVIAKTASTILTAIIIIVVYSLIMIAAIGTVPGIEQQTGNHAIQGMDLSSIIPLKGILISFLLSGFSMVFLLFVAMSIVFVIEDYNNAINISTAIVDGLAIPGFFIAMTGKVINVLVQPAGRVLLMLDPATSPVIVVFAYMIGNNMLALATIIITIALTIIAGMFAVKSLKL